MWRFKGCPRCRGDLYVDYDSYGCFKECLQCGYIVDCTDEERTRLTQLRRGYRKEVLPKTRAA